MKDYLIYEFDKGVSVYLKFQILSQSPKVKAFFDYLAEMGITHYLSKSGYKVAIDDFPEFKISENTIFLRGNMKSQNMKVDVTPFVNDRTYRKGSEKMFREAISEVIGEVRKADEAGLLDGPSHVVYAGNSCFSTFTPPYGVRRVKRVTNPMANRNKIRKTADLFALVNDSYGCTNLENWMCKRNWVAPLSSYPSYRSNVEVITL